MLRSTILTTLFVLISVWTTGIPTVLEARIITLWTFDEGQGKVVKDISGNGNDGKIEGGKWIDGIFGKALELDKDSFVEIENPKGTVFDLPNALTVQIWAYITDLTQCCGGFPRIMDSGDAAGWVMHPTKEGNGYRMFFWAHIGGKWVGAKAAGILPFSKDWHHFAATYDGKTLKLYVDGALADSQAAPGKINSGDGALRFSHEFNNRITIGAIDEGLVADEALPEADIKKSAKEGLQATFPAIFAVNPREKVTTTWGRIKLQ
ncbi:MAG: LamG domain-containing protein [Ignavibacteria bacterium]|nr:LamG domain-containing protein [Ignavibacteria bacterium]